MKTEDTKKVNLGIKLTVAVGAAVIVGMLMGTISYANRDSIRHTWVRLTLSDAEINKIQEQNIVNHIQVMYKGQAFIPNGDITETVAFSGGLVGWLPDAPMDSIENEQVRQSMSRLHYEKEHGVVVDQDGTKLKVLAKDGQISVVRSK